MSTTRYEIPKNDEKLKASLLYITHSTNDGDWNSTLHSHHCTEIFYVLRGKGEFRVENETFKVKEDDLIVVNPLMSHTEIGINNEFMEYVVIGVENFELADSGERFGYTLSNYRNYKHEILFYLKTMLVEAENKDDHYEIICQYLLEILIINMMRRSKFEMRASQNKNDNKYCRFVEKYINDHFKENITIDLLSKISYMNKYHLIHSFTKYKGMSPIRYVLEKRLIEAKMLLMTTDLNMGEIADIVGFSSPSYFAQTFKKYVHVSPLQYRKNNSN